MSLKQTHDAAAAFLIVQKTRLLIIVSTNNGFGNIDSTSKTVKKVLFLWKLGHIVFECRKKKAHNDRRDKKNRENIS